MPAFSSFSGEDSESKSNTHQSDSDNMSTVYSGSVEWSNEEAVISDNATVGSLDTIENKEMNKCKKIETRWNLRHG